MPILFDADRQMWALHGRTMSYGIGVDRQIRLVNVHFGARLLSHIEFGDPNFGYPFGASFDPTGGLVQFEYPTQTGMYYYEPCLKATFADGVRDVLLVYQRQDQQIVDSIPTLVITLRDAYYSLQVQLHYRLFEDCDLIER